MGNFLEKKNKIQEKKEMKKKRNAWLTSFKPRNLIFQLLVKKKKRNYGSEATEWGKMEF